jgi:hypothetical protein
VMRIGDSVRSVSPTGAAIAEPLRVEAEPAGFGRLGTRRCRASRRHYREARLEPGDVITVVGRALPSGDLPDPPAGHRKRPMPSSPATRRWPPIRGGPRGRLARRRSGGRLGNAGIPGFGIGQPIRAAGIDPAASLPLATRARRARRADVRDRPRDARGHARTRSAAHRPRRARDGRGASRRPVPAGAGRCGRVGDLCDGSRSC